MKKILIFVGIIFALISAVVILPDINRRYISDTLLRYPGIDKPVHFIEFIIIFCFMYFISSFRIFNLSEKKRVFAAILISLCVSVIDEFHQSFVPERSFEYADLLANTLGILTGITIIYSIIYSRKIPAAITASILSAVLVIVSLITFASHKKTRHFNKAILYEREKNFKDAMKQYLLAVKSGNTSSSLYNNMAWINIEFLNGDPEISYEYARKALSLNPDNADILDTYGWALLQMNKPEEAVKYLKEAFRINPNIYVIHYHLGSTYAALGKWEEAIYHLNKQIDFNSNDRFAVHAQKALEKLKLKEFFNHGDTEARRKLI